MNINLISKKALSINNSEIKLDNEEKIKSDLLLSTGSSLPNWLENSNLKKLEFIVVNSQLQSLNYKNIFGGDVASIVNYSRTKSV